MRYVLDTSAILQAPKILAIASTRRLIIPSSVLGELRNRGRDEIRNRISLLVEQAVIAGAEVSSSPATLKQELLASDRNVQRLSGADIDIARIAIACTESLPPQEVAVVTFDRDLIQYLLSRGIQTISPAELLAQSTKEDPDPQTLISADSFSKFQRRYIVLSAIGASVLFVAGKFVYDHASYLVNTIPVWGTLIALPLFGIVLFWCRQRLRLSYGFLECVVGFITSGYVFYPNFQYAGMNMIQGVQVLGGLYVMVRGLDNVGKGIENTKFESRWKKVFS